MDSIELDLDSGDSDGPILNSQHTVIFLIYLFFVISFILIISNPSISFSIILKLIKVSSNKKLQNFLSQ